jgi:hypothetical protein
MNDREASLVEAYNRNREALLQIKAAVEQNECSVVGAFALRADVKAILAEAGI